MLHIRFFSSDISNIVRTYKWKSPDGPHTLDDVIKSVASVLHENGILESGVTETKIAFSILSM